MYSSELILAIIDLDLEMGHRTRVVPAALVVLIGEMKMLNEWLGAHDRATKQILPCAPVSASEFSQA